MARRKRPGESPETSTRPVPRTRDYYLKDVTAKAPILAVQNERRHGSQVCPIQRDTTKSMARRTSVHINPTYTDEMENSKPSEASCTADASCTAEGNIVGVGSALIGTDVNIHNQLQPSVSDCDQPCNLQKVILLNDLNPGAIAEFSEIGTLAHSMAEHVLEEVNHVLEHEQPLASDQNVELVKDTPNILSDNESLLENSELKKTVKHITLVDHDARIVHVRNDNHVDSENADGEYNAVHGVNHMTHLNDGDNTTHKADNETITNVAPNDIVTDPTNHLLSDLNNISVGNEDANQTAEKNPSCTLPTKALPKSNNEDVSISKVNDLGTSRPVDTDALPTLPTDASSFKPAPILTQNAWNKPPKKVFMNKGLGGNVQIGTTLGRHGEGTSGTKIDDRNTSDIERRRKRNARRNALRKLQRVKALKARLALMDHPPRMKNDMCSQNDPSLNLAIVCYSGVADGAKEPCSDVEEEVIHSVHEDASGESSTGVSSDDSRGDEDSDVKEE